MSKTFKTMCLLFALIFITVGCGTEKTQEVANYDEAYHVEQRDHYRSLHRYLSDEYENDLDDMKKDPLFPEYVRLNGIYGVGQAREWDNFKGTVHLDQQTIQSKLIHLLLKKLLYWIPSIFNTALSASS